MSQESHPEDCICVHCENARMINRDAARYRWVRENGPYNWAPWATAEEMDAEIDAKLALNSSGEQP